MVSPSRALLFLGALLCCAACERSTEPPADEPEFVAEESDFAGINDWLAIPLPDTDPLSKVVYPTGARTGLLNKRPPHGATSYPTGTILVKKIAQDEVIQNWHLFALSKRGNRYNAAGAVGWEFLLLAYGADNQLHIASRGITPDDDGHLDMGANADLGATGGYWANGVIAPCNICHGMSGYAVHDHVISPLLAPSATALP